MRQIAIFLFSLFLSSCVSAGKYYPPIDYDAAPHYVSEMPGSNMLLTAAVNKNEVYPDEQFVVTYALKTRYDTRYEGVHDEIDTPGFWFRGISPAPPAEIERNAVTHNGKKYIEAVINKMAFFAMRPGNYQIKMPELNFSIRQEPVSFFSFFNSPVGVIPRDSMRMSAPPVAITVWDFPKPAPAGFNGSSGKYSLSAVLEGPQSGTGAYMLEVTVTGEGNLWKVDLPRPAGFEESFYLLNINEVVEDEVSWKEAVVKGKKKFQYRLAPKKSGTLTIPAFSFVYFNPANKAYETAVTQPLTITVPDSYKPGPAPEKEKSGLAVVIDRSGSMLAEDIGIRSRRSVSTELAEKLLNVSPADWFGVVAFAASLEWGYGPAEDLPELLTLVQSEKEMSKDGTAVGDALYTALKAFDQHVAPDGKKQILLIGDGANNAGHIFTKDAVDMAVLKGIVIHSVAIGKGTGLSPFPVYDPVKGKQYVQAKVEVDTSSLEYAAQATGGRLFKIDDSSQIDPVIQELTNLLK